MKFSSFHLLSGVLIGVASVKTTVAEPDWSWLFALGAIMTIIGACLDREEAK